MDLLKKFGIAFVAVLAIGASVASGSSSTEDDASGESTSTEQSEAPAEETEEAPAEESAAGVGDPVRDGKFEFTVTDVETGLSEIGENEFLTEEAQGEYTVVSLKIENIGDEAQTFFSDNVSGVDSKDREVESDSTATLYANEGSDAWISEINPGNSIKADVVFDLAKGVDLASVTLQDSAFSGGAVVVLK